MKSKSVAIIGTRGYPSFYGGFETLVRRLAPYLADEGWDVTVYGRPGSTQSKPTRVDSRVKTVETKGFETKSLSTLSYGLTSSIDAARHKPDVALVMNIANGFWLPLLKSRNIPTVTNVDGIEWDRAKWGKNAKRVFRQGAKLTAKHSTRLVCDAVAIQNIWRDQFGREGDFIPYGSDIIDGTDAPDGLQKRKYILMVARFVPENTVPEFLEAARILSKSWDVVIVGSSGYGGPIEDQVSQLVASNPRVRWYGHISDDAMLFSLWQNAGVYFHGHSVGGTNPALVQAMACGAPTVARDTKYNREVLGEAGWFTQPNAQSIADDIAGKMGQPDGLELNANEAQHRAKHLYSWADICQKYEASLIAAIGYAEEPSVSLRTRSR